MNIRSTWLALIPLAFIATGASASVTCENTADDLPGECSAVNPANGHTYVVVPSVGITWDAANEDAESDSRVRDGIRGHLATATSATEDAFVDELRQSAEDQDFLAQSQAWIGGFQADGSQEPGGGWQWVNDEGAFPGSNCFPTLGCADAYANWADGEPNNAGNGENGLTLGRYGLGNGWNDEGSAPNSVGGYIIEYRNSAPAEDCLELADGEDETSGGCNPSGVALLQLDNETQTVINGEPVVVTQGLVAPDPELIDMNVDPAVAALCDGEFLFPDPRVDVNGRAIDLRTLDVFGELGGGAAGSLILDEQTYGSPCFAVVSGEANFTLIDTLPGGGAASVTQVPEDVPGSFSTLLCYDPNTNPDLQAGAQAAYQPDDRFRMFEEAAAAMTNNCNSPSRSSTPEFSFYVLNTHEDCGPAVSGDGPEAVLTCFRTFAGYKQRWLLEQLKLAQPALVSPDYSVLSSLISQSRRTFRRGQYGATVALLEDFLDEVENASWNLDSNGINHPGYLIMRTRNLILRLEQLEQAEANLP